MKYLLLFTGFLIILSGCGTPKKKEVAPVESKNQEEASTIPKTIEKEDSNAKINQPIEEVVEELKIEKKEVINPQNVVKTPPVKKDIIPLEDNPKEEKLALVDSLSLKKTKTPPQVFNHSRWDDLLKKHVSSTGAVDYAGFKKDKSELETYITELQLEYKNLSSWTYNQKLAYWINVYNAYTVKLIVDNYPTSSITKLKGGKPWDARIIELGDQTYSLNNIENDIIRVRFNDPRIHVGVNCASISCPKLLNRAFTQDNINIQLTLLMKKWLSDPTKNQLTKNKLKLSKIFDWYKVDFTKNGSVIDFLKQYSDVEIDDNASIEYLEYNWNLNGI